MTTPANVPPGKMGSYKDPENIGERVADVRI
jgi:hypothetical protein